MSKSRRQRRKQHRLKQQRSKGTPPRSAPRSGNRLAISKAIAKHKVEAIPRDVIDQSLAWYIVQTRSGKEAEVEKAIRGDPDNADPKKRRPRLGAVYRPREIVKRGRRGTIYHTTRHLMPRSMFFGCDRAADPRVVLGALDDVFGLLRRTDGLIVRIAPAELQRFADVVSDELAPLAGAGKTVLKAKDEVVLNSGPFVGFKAVVLAPAKGGFVKLSLTLMDAAHELTAPIDGLLAA